MSFIRGRKIDGQSIKIETSQGKIIAIENIDTKEILPYIGAGLCDLQINGYVGVDFNGDKDLTPSDLESLQDVYLKDGCTTFLPTIITNDPKNISKRIKNIKECMKSIPSLEKSIIGFHIEGPFISPLDGARGAHAKEFVCKPDIEVIKEWQEISEGMIKIITLSPEWENANEEIKKITDMGICVSIGHTMATVDQISEAVVSGARMVTHFGNGVPIEIRRHPNFLWQELAEDNLSLGIIADGFHLPDAVLKTVLAVKKENCFLVSDSTAFGGKSAGIYDSHIGGKVVLSEEGRLSLFDSPDLLAGSAQSLRHGVEHLLNKGLANLEYSWDLGSRLPAQKIGHIKDSSLSIGSHANLTLFTYDNKKLTVLETFLHGEKISK